MTTSTPAVRADGIWKVFHRGERHDSLRDLIPAVIRGLRPQRKTDQQELGSDGFWAVRDVSFDVEFGRALGIIGPNGAGKSTMLKLLTGILRPTRGEIRMRGRVASLIEVSAGFHQDLTGRENIYLQGAIMGMTRREIDARLDSIIDFSGIERFIDTPVKRYSSGMNARLGFAIAVHLDPDVLVIDEVLSVGDMAFQQKCVDRMKAFKRDGVAIVFVSHNMQAVGELCDEAMVINGSRRFLGNVPEAVHCYLALAGGEGPTTHGDGLAATDIVLTDESGAQVDAVGPHANLRLSLDLHVSQTIPNATFSLIVRRATDTLVVYDGSYTSEELGLGPLEAGTTVRLALDHKLHLTRGQYSYEFTVFDPDQEKHRLWVIPAAGVRVDEYRTWSGVTDIELRAAGTVLAPTGV